MERKEVIKARKIEGYCAFCSQSESACPHYMTVEQSGFRELKLAAGESFTYDVTTPYVVCFARTGRSLLACREGNRVLFPEHSMVLFSQGDTIYMTATGGTEIILFAFDSLPNFCAKVKLETFAGYCGYEYDYTPTTMHPNIRNFLSECIFFMKYGMHCGKLFRIKQAEFFYLIAVHYSPVEVASFLFPIIGKSLDFRATVIRNYSMSVTAADLIKRTGYGRNDFYTRFKEEFGMPVKEWIVKQRLGQMRIIALEPRMTAKQMMHRCGFSSSCHFAQFCKRHTGMTPTELINSMKGGENVKK